LRTERLLLRQWTDADREPFAALNADPAVMAHFPAPMTREQSDELVDRCAAALAKRGYAFWAVEVLETGRFIGFTGLSDVGFQSAFTPAVEIGWRLSKDAWGNGFASEAARACLAHAFGAAGLEEVVSFTATTNKRSQRVMERIGMTHDEADDFDHPRLEAGHRLERHVLYRITREQWSAGQCRTA
jgi:RimJ/RimL family protein N-acetyltransferase